MRVRREIQITGRAGYKGEEIVNTMRQERKSKINGCKVNVHMHKNQRCMGRSSKKGREKRREKINLKVKVHVEETYKKEDGRNLMQEGQDKGRKC